MSWVRNPAGNGCTSVAPGMEALHGARNPWPFILLLSAPYRPIPRVAGNRRYFAAAHSSPNPDGRSVPRTIGPALDTRTFLRQVGTPWFIFHQPEIALRLRSGR